MRILWARSALLDLIALRDYIAQYHPQAAARIAAEIVATAELLALSPALGTALPKPGYRRLVIGGTVYILIYRSRGEDLEILEVFDARRRRPRNRFESVRCRRGALTPSSHPIRLPSASAQPQ